MKTFKEKVLDIVSKIRAGETMSYGEVAKLAGSPQAGRAVGNIMKENRDPAIPCHRVILGNGKPGRYNRGDKKKIKILRAENPQRF